MRFGTLALSLLCLPTLAGAGMAAGQEVGVTAAVNQSALGTPPAAAPRTMVLGDKVIHNEKIVTNGKGLLQILLADGTSFTVGPSSTLAIDSFVYDPAAGTAKVVATLGKGVFRFIGGKTSKSPDGVTLNTPVGTVGIRGGISDLDFSGKGGIPFHIDMIYGQSINLVGSNGQMLGHIYQPGYSIVINGGGQTAVQKTPAGWTQSFQASVTSKPGQHGGTAAGSAVTTSTVADALGGTNSGANPPSQPNGTSGAGGGTTTVPGNTQPPPPFTPPDLTSGTSTWADIDNSDLANRGAIYTGVHQYTETFDGPPTQGTGSFVLGYAFGTRNGAGVLAIFSQPGAAGNEADFAVTPLAPDGNGDASFHGAADSDQYAGTVEGHFVNTPAGIAHGVTGSDSFYFQTPDDQVVGTFDGDLQASAPIPPP